MDAADRAAVISAAFLERSLAAWAAGRTGPGGTRACVECEFPIPEARRRLVPNADRCTECQAGRERAP